MRQAPHVYGHDPRACQAWRSIESVTDCLQQNRITENGTEPTSDPSFDNFVAGSIVLNFMHMVGLASVPGLFGRGSAAAHAQPIYITPTP